MATKDILLARLQARKTVLMMQGDLAPAALVTEIQNVIGFLSQIPRGEKGYTPVLGKDYFTEVDKRKIVDQVLKLIPVPKNTTPSKNGVSIEEVRKLVVDLLRETKGKSNPSIQADGLTPVQQEVIFQKLRATFLESSQFREAVVKILKEYIKETPKRDFRSYVPEIFIGARTGGTSTSSSTSISVNTPAESVDGNTTVFTVSVQPLWVVSDGVTYYEGAGYSYSAGNGQVTLDVPPSSFIRYIIS